jgi:hypothetical protein
MDEIMIISFRRSVQFTSTANEMHVEYLGKLSSISLSFEIPATCLHIALHFKLMV